MAQPVQSVSSTAYKRVADLIHADIVAGVLTADTRLKVNELSVRYGVSPSPVREALQQLQSEGLIVMTPNRGATVRNIDATEFAHLMHIRAAVEGMQSRIFALSASPRQVEEVAEVAAQFAEAVRNGDETARFALNTRLHELIIGVDGNTFASEIVARARSLTSAVRRAWAYDEERLASAIREHDDLVAAFRRGDGDTAEALAREHVIAGLRDVLALMAKAGIDCEAASALLQPRA